jgi:hypothetical protein
MRPPSAFPPQQALELGHRGGQPVLFEEAADFGEVVGRHFYRI